MDENPPGVEPIVIFTATYPVGFRPDTSHHADDATIRYFGGTVGHNTVQFDDRDPMPRMSRLLLGDGLQAQAILPVTETAEAVTAAAGYTDRQGASHQRQLWLSAHRLRVADAVAGFAHRAVLRWRLSPGDWRREGDTARRGDHTLRVTATVPMRMRLVSGWESRYYLQKDAVPVLEVDIQQPGRFLTEYRFSGIHLSRDN